MPILSKCCCCSLQAGVITIGVLGLILPTILTGVMIYFITIAGVAAHGQDAQIDQLKNQLGSLLSDKDLADIDAKRNQSLGLSFGLLVGITVILIFLIIMNILLIVGACKDKAKLLLPWMGYVLLTILADIIWTIYTFAGPTGFNFLFLLQCIFSIGLVVLVWLCVFSLYQEINERRQNQTYQQPMQKM